jgi:hypothetical protein
MDVRGFAHAPVQNISLQNITVDQAAEASRIEHVNGLALNNVKVNGDEVTNQIDLLEGIAGQEAMTRDDGA